jgi:hypothetical protein
VGQGSSTLAERYGSSQQPILSNLDQDLPAPFDKTRLMEQKDTYCLLYGAERVGKPTASFRHTVSNSVELKCSLSECLSLANIALVQVPGSERSLHSERRRSGFSASSFIKDERRNRLLSDHLNACLVLATQRMWA